MKASRGVITLLAISAALALGQAPSVPKLPHVPTGKMTASGFRLYGEKNITAQRPYSVTKDETYGGVCGAPPPSLGSSFKIAISRQTGAILYLEE